MDHPVYPKIKKNGFKKCGIIYLLSGDPRVAYQWHRE